MMQFISVGDVDIDGLSSQLSVPFAWPVGDDRHRVFFSYRDAELRAHAGSLELSLQGSSFSVASARGSIISPAPPGHFDQHGIIPSSIIAMGDRLFLYYIGRTQGERPPMWYAGIGLAISEDGGETFERYSPAPIFSINRFDPCLVTAPYVIKHEDRYWMFYVSCFRWEEVDGALVSYYDVRRATSRDGIGWEPEGRSILPLRDQERNIGRPWVRKGVDGWQLWYSFAGQHPYRIGRAVSENFHQWRRDDEAVRLEFANSPYFDDMQCYASFFTARGRDLMMVNGNRFGKEGFAICEPVERETLR